MYFELDRLSFLYDCVGIVTCFGQTYEMIPVTEYALLYI